MRVLHITQGYPPAKGGTERLMQRLSEELVNQFGDEVTVFTTNCYSADAFSHPELPRMPTGWEAQAGVRVRRFGVQARIGALLFWPQAAAYGLRLPLWDHLSTWYNGPIVPGLGAAIRAQPADVIAASSFPLLHMHVAVKTARTTSRPCVLLGGLHPDDRWGFQRPNIYAAIRRATFYVAYTDFEADHVIRRGMPPDRVAVAGVGVDPEPFQAVSADAAKTRLGLTGKTVVGFVGQLGAHKGLDTLLSAMPAVWAASPEVHLLIAGAWSVYAARLEALFQTTLARFKENVTFIYNFDESRKSELFNAIDVFAYPSGFESFGIAFLEAWSAGKPVIGCRRGAVPWVVEAGHDGLLVPYQRPAALASAIQALLDNPSAARAMGEAGRKKMLARYTWPIVARRFRDVYRQAVELSQR